MGAVMAKSGGWEILKQMDLARDGKRAAQPIERKGTSEPDLGTAPEFPKRANPVSAELDARQKGLLQDGG